MAGFKLVWPSPNPAFQEGRPAETFVQPAGRGEASSGLFGCVRNNGRKFHEGLDLKAVKRGRRGEAADEIFAAMDGRVAWINKIAGRSSYGRYIVLEHPAAEPAVYTLYAHLKSVRRGLKTGQNVAAGSVIGTMGRSAMNYRIPKARAHLHFEIGLRLSDDFQSWYDRQDYEFPNQHGNYNGINLAGFDPLDFYSQYRAGKISSVRQYARSLETACAARVRSASVPDFIRRYPSLLTDPIPDDLAGWEIGFTWFGLPVRWTPLTAEDLAGKSLGKIVLLCVDEEILRRRSCRGVVLFKGGKPEPGPRIRGCLGILFGSL